MFAGLQSHPWAYPALEVVHIMGIALLFGNLVLLEVRAFGRGASLPWLALAQLSLLLALGGFLLAAGSGLLMFASQPGDLLANRSFTLKMLLLFAAGANAAAFHARGSLRRMDRIARAQLLLSLAIWIAVIVCGRWIAYV
ncbi:hypothetical protein [Ramlibacter rhizophilus]|uniref:DUF2214 family protein n=1 Tax=Ramlibacter rhizophilus TaxID=1781167 RepID=A0A4Z0C1F5_9BURK|nr:hypothetical protein [Ramlibacter rhizophilus]TFZ04762.1 hypothetical protein EZ242_03155 [Ramlibacter rhizophilus]